MTPDTQLKRAARFLADAKSIAVLTGAGVSKESGIATFRDTQDGLWANFDPETLASRAGFRRDPGLVWRWYAWRAQRIHEVQPNAGHYALAELERRKTLTVITQNVDGLHPAAGSQNVLELHGNLMRIKCFDRDHPMPDASWENEEPPECPRCGSLGRPDVVWFGEVLPGDILEQAYAAVMSCDLMMVLGTSGLVQPAASLPLLAKRRGAKTIEVNPEVSALTADMAVSLRGPSGVILPQLLAALDDA